MIFICLFLFLASGSLYCAQAGKIELTDGSVINAQVVSLENGIYTLDGGSLGIFKINASEIRKIEIENSTGAPATGVLNTTGPDIKSGVDKVRTKMMSNPEILKIVTELAGDPQFQEITKDPQIVSALYSGNLQALMSNQRFMELISHPQIKEINDKLKD